MADITGRDSDGELIATPTEWDEEQSGAPPKIRIHVPRRPQPGTAAGVGDRALLRVEKPDDGEGAVYRGRVIKVVDHAKTRVLGIFRSLPGGGGRLIPVDKKQAGRELNIAKADAGGAEDGDLVSVDLIRSRGFGLASGKVKERLGSLASEKAVSLIAIHAHEIPQAFSPAALREAEEEVGLSREFLAPGFTKPTTVRFDIVNLFDTIYEIRDGSGIGVFAPQFGPRRGFYVGISQKL